MFAYVAYGLAIGKGKAFVSVKVLDGPFLCEFCFIVSYCTACIGKCTYMRCRNPTTIDYKIMLSPAINM